MKKKTLALTLGIMMALSSVSVYAENGDAASEAPAQMPGGQMETPDENSLSGTVTLIAEDSITIKAEGSEEEQTISITEETTFEKGGMGGPGGDGGQGGPGGDGGDGGDGGQGGPGGDGGAGGPDGAPDGEAPGGEAPGGAPDGGMPGENSEATIEDLSEGDTVTITLAEDGSAASIRIGGGQKGPGGQGGQGTAGGPGGGSQGVTSYTAVNTYTEDTTVEGESISSTGADENAVLVQEGATVTLNAVTLERTSSDSSGGDNASFYGVGAAVLATDGTAVITDSTITTDSAGGAGAFAYGDGTVYVENTAIQTEQSCAGGIHAAGGGTLYAFDCTVETQGGSSAAVRSDRGGGTMVVDGGSYTANGNGSPAVYCTADISIHGADLTATGSEAVCIEGLNTLRLFDCNLSGDMEDQEQNDNTWTVIVYQSMSGDSEVGNGTFEMNGGTLTSGNGGLFYTTNTECTFTLNNVEIIPSDTNAFFLQCTGNSNQRGWGQSGANGSDCLFTAIAQEMTGDVIWDSISQLDFLITDGSVLTGAVLDDETWAGEGGDGTCSLVIDEDSSWIVTGDSTLTSLSNAGRITDAEGKSVTVKGNDGTVYVEGESAYTITVDSYEESADTSAAQASSSWESYQVERA